MSDYTNRNLAYQGDTERALLGVFECLAGHFHRSFINGLLNTELEDALLWCPIGSSERRIDPQTWGPLFPSWSWLGWIGHAAYPWAVERYFPSSSVQFSSSLAWRKCEEEPWFTKPQYRYSGHFPEYEGTRSRWRRDPDDSWCFIDEEDEPHRWLRLFICPCDRRRPFRFLARNSRQLCFRTLSARFTIADQIARRKETTITNTSSSNYDFSIPETAVLGTRAR